MIVYNVLFEFRERYFIFMRNEIFLIEFIIDGVRLVFSEYYIFLCRVGEGGVF